MLTYKSEIFFQRLNLLNMNIFGCSELHNILSFFQRGVNFFWQSVDAILDDVSLAYVYGLWNLNAHFFLKIWVFKEVIILWPRKVYSNGAGRSHTPSPRWARKKHFLVFSSSSSILSYSSSNWSSSLAARPPRMAMATQKTMCYTIWYQICCHTINANQNWYHFMRIAVISNFTKTYFTVEREQTSINHQGA